MSRRRIAIIGGGVAGIHAAHLLQETHAVTLFERDARLGGHANPFIVDNTAVDTAFMIFNAGSYPHFMAWLDELGVAGSVQDAEMSFGFFDDETGLRFAVKRGLAGLFAQPGNLTDPTFWGIFADLLRFRRRAFRDLEAGAVTGTLQAYLSACGYSKRFRDDFICPMGMAVWSVPRKEVLELPAETFLRFLGNHGYLKGKTAGKWKTLRGSSQVYLDAFRRRFRGEIRTGAEVTRIARDVSGARLTVSGATETFDAVVFATHADDTLRLLGEGASPEEKRLLGPWRYHSTEAILHTDPSLLPADRKVWSSWNMRWGRTSAVTYYLNRVQNLDLPKDYFITFDRKPADLSKVVKRFRFKHPIFDEGSIATQAGLSTLNGRTSYFCGSYFGFGFHEDAIRSSRAVAATLTQRSAGESR